MSIIRRDGGYYDYSISNESFLVKIENTGEMAIEFYTNSEIKIYSTYWVGANYDIYYQGNVVYAQNYGYKYDSSNEEQYKCDEVVKLTEESAIYMGAANNYVKITTLPKDQLIKRINKGVNERNGHIWDKVEISNGKEGYVLSESLQILGQDEFYENLNFEYNNKTYDLYFSPSQCNLDIKIEDYPYYFIRVGSGTTSVMIYYTKEAMSIIRRDGAYYDYSIKSECFLVKIENTGKITIELCTNKEIKLHSTYWIGANYDIYLGESVIYKQNNGYEYDPFSEEEYKCDEVVKLKDQTAIYMGAANNYVKITTLPKGQLIKRINKSVNETNGKKWDKVRISNGKEGYALSENLQNIENGRTYGNLNFEYNHKTYDLYFSPSQCNLDIKIEDYPYYFIRVGSGTTSVMIYYTKEAMSIIRRDGGYYDYLIKNECFLIKIENTGEVIIEPYKNKEVKIYSTYWIGSNYDIHYGSNIIYHQNHIYKYDASNEMEEKYECDEVVKIKESTTIYEGAALNHKKITILAKGDIVKRIKKSVNEKNGHIWDKIRLNNGVEGYIFSDRLELAGTKYIEIEIPDGERVRTIYFEPEQYGIDNINEYPYFFVARTLQEKGILICYSKEETMVRTVNNIQEHYGTGMSLVVEINEDGSMKGKVQDIAIEHVPVCEDGYLISNYNIFSATSLTTIFEKKVYIDGLGFVSHGWSEIKTDVGTYDIIKQGEEEYASCSSELDIADYTTLLKSMTVERDLLYRAAWTAQIAYPNASQAFMYFTSSGEHGKTEVDYSYEEDIYTTKHTRRQIPIKTVLNESEDVQNKFRKNIQSVIKASEKLCVKDKELTIIALEYEDTGRAGRQSSYTDTNADWYAALNRYRIKMYCWSERDGDNYTISMGYGIVDYYDWFQKEYRPIIDILKEVGEFTDVAEDVIAKECRLMHQLGISRNYTNYGTITFKVVWNAKDSKGYEFQAI